MRIVKVGLIMPLLVACQQEPVPQDAGAGLKLDAALASQSFEYACGRGQTLTVSYDQGGIAHMVLDGEELSLPARQAERGAAYGNGKVTWTLVNADDREVGTLENADGVVTQCARRANTAAPAPTLTACRAEQLQATAGEIDAGMGHRHLPVTLTVKGTTGCLLPKWPEVSLVQDAGKPLKVERTTDSYFASVDGRDRIELQPSKSVQFYLGWSVIPNEAAGETECPAVSGWTIKAPGGGTLPTLPAQATACGGKINVSAFTDSAANGEAGPKTTQ
ncbi:MULTISPECIES: DUF4232 domain-containing protein [unclassified Brevundimonas]|uniref:DUF4232 domain-containing protein n=1 Tax=unclassified Brevundimonas TaxID=2622653 RepID=UPI0025C4D9E5|nr:MULTISPECIES: DUF4232 domain-containing protein [unclassified Brevundimonas]